MAEIADAILSGLFCEGCGEVFDDMEEPGYPRKCEACDTIVGRNRGAHDAASGLNKLASSIAGLRVGEPLPARVKELARRSRSALDKKLISIVVKEC